MYEVSQFEDRLKARGLRAITIRGYVHDAQQFLVWAREHGISLGDVTFKEAQKYVDHLLSSQHELRPGVFGIYSTRTVRKKIVALRLLFDFLESNLDQ